MIDYLEIHRVRLERIQKSSSLRRSPGDFSFFFSSLSEGHVMLCSNTFTASDSIGAQYCWAVNILKTDTSSYSNLLCLHRLLHEVVLNRTSEPLNRTTKSTRGGKISAAQSEDCDSHDPRTCAIIFILFFSFRNKCQC